MSRLAIHEAAHAVVALSLGYKVESARTTGPDGGAVACAWADVDNAAGLADSVRIALAGTVAESLAGFAWQPPRLNPFVAAGDLDHVARAARVLEAVGYSTREQLESETRGLLIDRWERVVAVADALEAGGVLTGREIEQILRKFAANPRPGSRDDGARPSRSPCAFVEELTKEVS